MYLCKLIMQKIVEIVALTLLMGVVACSGPLAETGENGATDIVATVDNHILTQSDIDRDMPKGLSDTDSVTFVRMYVENWVLNKLKIRRANEVLSSHQEEIERLVEGYRQSLIMRQLDQYYIDNAIDLEVTEKQLSAYYRANAASFKLDHDKVRGVVVKTSRNFRNTTTLTTALKGVAKRGDAEEVRALAEKHNLQITDCTPQWVSYSDFLSNLPTERTSSYTHLLGQSGVQSMTTGDAMFYFVIVDVARKGDVAPLECVKEDILRRLYAERRNAIVTKYESELKYEAVANGRVVLADTILLNAMSYRPEPQRDMSDTVVEAEEHIDEDVPSMVVEDVQ